jgi:2-polyprenyl-3-methyl-5-hydroxy-6-metoxy-1,4-benzoquinol methylase
MKKFLNNLYTKAVLINKNNILSLIETNPYGSILDLGCDEGSWTLEVAKKMNSKSIYGIEIVNERLLLAMKKGILVKDSDLNLTFPFDNESFDVIHANQVIEHIAQLDNFISEISRVLKNNGYAIISTENGSSWCNVIAAICGWQIFSSTNMSSKTSGIGNPLALHRTEDIDLSSWTHKTIFNYRGFKEIFEAYGFKVESIKGAGYFPLPGIIGTIDVRHSHFITIKIRKSNCYFYPNKNLS